MASYNFGPEVWAPGLNNTSRPQPPGPHREASKSKKGGPPKLATTLSRKFSAAASSIFHPEDSGAESGNESANDSDNESPVSISQTRSALPHIRSPEKPSKGHNSSANSVHSDRSARSSPVEASLSNHSVMSPAGLPGKKNILYKIFHPNDESNGMFGRSRRSYQSGSEDESGMPTTTDESDAESEYADSLASGSLSRPASAQSGASPRLSMSDDEPHHGGDKKHSAKARAGRPSIFKDLLPRNSSSKKSTSSSHDSETEDDSESEGEHTSNVKDLFKGLISRKSTTQHNHHRDDHLHSNAGTPNGSVPGIKLDRPAPPASTTQTTIAQIQRSGSESSLSEKYGKKEDVLGKGANAIVRLCCPVNSDKKYAIKEFRKRRKDESQKEYVKKLVSEFCISSSLDNENVVKTVDLIQDDKKQWCVVMEYVAGGDLYSRIHSGTLTESPEIFCYFKQLVNGVKYLHGMGVAHRDLKPENLLLDMEGKTLKITDFGVSEVFRTPFCSARKKARGLCGSGPYIAPEEFDSKEYDAEEVDVWAIGIIFYVMAFQSIPWRGAVMNDSRYKYYVEHHGKFWPFDRLIPAVRKLLYKILEPDPEKRITVDGILADEWFKSVCCCVEKHEGKVDHTHSPGVEVRDGVEKKERGADR